MSERLEVKYKVKAKTPKGVKVPAAVKEAAFRKWLQTGRTPKGFKLVVSFRNPNRGNAEKARWKHSTDPDQSLAAIRGTLHLAGWIA